MPAILPVNEEHKLSWPQACALAFAFFTAASLTVAVMLGTGNEVLEYVVVSDATRHLPSIDFDDSIYHGVEQRARATTPRIISDDGAAGVALVFGVAIAILVASSARSRSLRTWIFHSAFFGGLVILGFSLLAILAVCHGLHPQNRHMFTMAFKAGLMICLYLIPLALLLISFATLYDRNRSLRVRD